MEVKEVLTLMGMFMTFFITTVSAWITVKVNVATLTQRIANLEKEVVDHNEWKVKLGDALNNLSVVLGKVEVRLETMNDDIKELKERGHTSP